MSFTMQEMERRERISQNEQSVTRKFHVVPGSARDQAIAAMLGGVKFVGGQLVRAVPMKDPKYPWLYCMEAEVEPFEALNNPGAGTAGTAAAAADSFAASCNITTVWKPLDYLPNEASSGSEKEFATVSYDFGSRSQTMPNEFWGFQQFTLEPMGDECQRAIPLRVENLEVTRTWPTVEYRIVRHLCLKVPEDTLATLSGRVNKRPFKIAKSTWPPETVLFLGAQTNQRVTIGGVPYVEIGYRFAIQGIYDFVQRTNHPMDDLYFGYDTTGTIESLKGYVGWNRIYRPVVGMWQRPLTCADLTRTVYDLDDDAPYQVIAGQNVKGFDLLFNASAN